MNSYTNEELIRHLRHAEENIIPLTADKFDENNDYPSKSTISKHFGSWNSACELAGVESGQVTKKSILRDIRKYYLQGEVLNSEEFYNHPDTPSGRLIYDYFSSWREAVDAAGVEAYSHYTKDDLIEYIEQFYDEFGYISAMEFDKCKNYPSCNTVIYHFDSWNNAVKKSTVEHNELGVSSNQDSTGRNKELFGKSYKNKRKMCFDRDDNVCKNCGSADDLQCHHEKPRRTYQQSEVFTIDDSNILDNLITLCRYCHIDIHNSQFCIDNSCSSLRPRIV